jgi:hypothetical protein
MLLRLVPFYLDRLHGPDVRGERADSDHVRFDLPFPFLRDAEPIDVVLGPGMTPAAIAKNGGGFEPNSSLGATSWWRWASYAITPFGWVAFPVAYFTNGVLSEVSLGRHGSTPERNFEATKTWLRQEIGAPPTVPSADSMLWTFRWGTMTLSFEPRDGTAQLRVAWSTGSPER